MDLKLFDLKTQVFWVMMMIIFLDMCWQLMFFEMSIRPKKNLQASRLWRLIIDKKQCVPVACQGKVSEKMDVAVKSGMSHPPDLIKSFSNHVKNCPES